MNSTTPFKVAFAILASFASTIVLAGQNSDRDEHSIDARNEARAERAERDRSERTDRSPASSGRSERSERERSEGLALEKYESAERARESGRMMRAIRDYSEALDHLGDSYTPDRNADSSRTSGNRNGKEEPDRAPD